MFVINATNGLDKLRNGENVIAVEMHASNSTNPTIQFDSQLFDNNNKIIYSLGSDWYYYDEGAMPPIQISDKVTGIVSENKNLLPDKTILFPNYPNPFNPTTNIGFQIADFGLVTLKVYDILGREVAELVNEMKQPGTYHYTLSTINYTLPSGVYFYLLRSDNFSEVRKMILLK
jgi:hypothetical protein